MTMTNPSIVDPPGSLTSADRVPAPSGLDVSRTRTIDEVIQEARIVVEDTGHFRNVTETYSNDFAGLQHRAFSVQLETQTARYARRSSVDLLDALGELGFSWSDLAKMLKVTVPAIRRWRRGEAPTGEHRRDIARLAAFVEILHQDQLVAEVASWMEVPIISGAPVTAIDFEK